MSKPRQIAIRELTKRKHLAVGNDLLAAQGTPSTEEVKIKAIRRAIEHSFPTADPEEMMSEIERGYQD